MHLQFSQSVAYVGGISTLECEVLLWAVGRHVEMSRVLATG